MSRGLLYQLNAATQQLEETQAQALCKQASYSRPCTTKMIEHTYADDLESLFYVFAFICIEYQGPLGMERAPSTITSGSTSWLPLEWSASTFKECVQAKTLFFCYSRELDRLEKQIHPYFQDLIPLAKEWYNLMKFNDQHPVRFDDVILMLDKHYNNLPKDEPSPELLLAKQASSENDLGPTLDMDDLGGLEMRESCCVPVVPRKGGY